MIISKQYLTFKLHLILLSFLVWFAINEKDHIRRYPLYIHCRWPWIKGDLRMHLFLKSKSHQHHNNSRRKRYCRVCGISRLYNVGATTGRANRWARKLPVSGTLKFNYAWRIGTLTNGPGKESDCYRGVVLLDRTETILLPWQHIIMEPYTQTYHPVTY